jgi:hypothetical protein
MRELGEVEQQAKHSTMDACKPSQIHAAAPNQAEADGKIILNGLNLFSIWIYNQWLRLKLILIW